MLKTHSAGTVVAWGCPNAQSNQRCPVATALSNQGYKLAYASQAVDVLQSALEYVPDLILVYLQTAGEEGYELCRNLRSLPNTNPIPIVFVGARDEKIELLKVLRCGGNDYLQLPMAEEECWLRTGRYLHNVQVLRQLEDDRVALHQQIWSYRRSLRQQQKIQVSLGEEIRSLQRLAFMDELTQVANRYKFNQMIAKLWQQAYSTRQPLSLLMCDIDYFKRYNDTYGHLGGDACLQKVAQALDRGLHRKGDQVARYGGEEFAILLPATDQQGAQRVALSVRAEVEALKIPHEASTVSPYVSLSIGICTLVPVRPRHAHEVLIHGADEALYTAKLEGRNRVVTHSPQGPTDNRAAQEAAGEGAGEMAKIATSPSPTEQLFPSFQVPDRNQAIA